MKYMETAKTIRTKLAKASDNLNKFVEATQKGIRNAQKQISKMQSELEKELSYSQSSSRKTRKKTKKAGK